MPNSNLQKWSSNLDCIDYAFQPIVNIHTGAVYGYEALIRNVEKAGFKSIFAFFDSAFENKVLHPLDLWLRQEAQKKETIRSRPSWPPPKHSRRLTANMKTRLIIKTISRNPLPWGTGVPRRVP